jgi:cobalt-zinc-cadmium resistance protein CzcA
MLEALVAMSIRYRVAVAGGLAALLLGGVWAVNRLPIDALPDVSTVQVTVLTEAPGLSPVEVERMVTAPVELAFNGLPRLLELRSQSKPGLSLITIVFEDGMDVWFARQLVAERLREVTVDLPEFVPPPQLSPVSTSLGEIFTFTLKSSTGDHSPMQLRTLLEWEVIPRLRSVPGVIEVVGIGGELKQFQVITSPARLKSYGVTLSQLKESLESSTSSVGGGYVERSGESLLLRGNGLLMSEEDIGNVVVRGGSQRVLVRQVADVKIGPALRYGVATRDGQGEVVSGTVMMLLGANSRDVVKRVKERVVQVEKALPPGVVVEAIYDRADFVNRVVSTVMKNLLEGALVVLLVLALFLGSLRGAVAVVLGIPASMTVALFGMHLFGVTGDLMSLGAIDFGFLVDGPIVILEAVMAAMAGKVFLNKREELAAFGTSASSVARPVAFSVAIIMLVYLPLLALQGVEGKMFRPMATVMACALFGALVYSVVFFPGVLALLMPPPKDEGPRWLSWLKHRYEAVLPKLLAYRLPLVVAMVVALLVSMRTLLAQGADFVPRIDEGDLVVTIRRAPSVALSESRRLDLEVERVLKRFPEVVTAVGFTGRAELAFDPRGFEATDMLVHLTPKEQWKTGKDLDELALAFKRSVENEVPNTFVSISQPIEDRTNELISGSRADVAIKILGPDLDTLVKLSNQVGDVVRDVRGTGDLRVERIMGLPALSFTPDRERLARYHVDVEEAFETIEAARVGAKVGTIYDGPRRYDLRVVVPPTVVSKEGIADMFVETREGELVKLGELGSIDENEGAVNVRRENFERLVRVEVNLRGRDLVSWVEEARARVSKEVQLPSSYTMTWGGQFENFERAQARLAIVVPLALIIIFSMLVLTFGSVRLAGAVFTLVPLALIGGAVGLLSRGMNFSIPGAVGFIALAGVAVLNGVVMTTDVRKALLAGLPLVDSVVHGAAHTLRAVLTTAAVAALGFAPMAVSTGAGSEVQRPLATVVIFGIVGATVLMLAVFPGILLMMLKGYQPIVTKAEEASQSSVELTLPKTAAASK